MLGTSTTADDFQKLPCFWAEGRHPLRRRSPAAIEHTLRNSSVSLAPEIAASTRISGTGEGLRAVTRMTAERPLSPIAQRLSVRDERPAGRAAGAVERTRGGAGRSTTSRVLSIGSPEVGRASARAPAARSGEDSHVHARPSARASTARVRPGARRPRGGRVGFPRRRRRRRAFRGDSGRALPRRRTRRSSSDSLPTSRRASRRPAPHALPRLAAIGEATVQLAMGSLIDAAHPECWVAVPESDEDPCERPVLRPGEL